MGSPEQLIQTGRPAGAGAGPADGQRADGQRADGRPTEGQAVGQWLDALRGRHVAFLNWRDLDHPQGGGAELYCQSIAERFAAAGVQVTLFTARSGGAPEREVARGVEIHRGGGTLGVYPTALARLARARHRVDAVVDCQNGIPFFSPLAVPASLPVVQVLHHVHQKQFPLYFPAPVARIGALLETPGSRWVYRRRPVVVVSPSTRDEAREVLGLRGPRYLCPNGVTMPASVLAGPGAAPPGPPTIVCVGRLVPHKRLHLLLEALPELLARHPGLRVDVVGDGPEGEALRGRARVLGLGPDVVRWHGFAPNTERDRLLAGATLTVNPSHGEGWGLSVLEANAYGVPAVAFRVPGLRDAVRDGYTGWLADSTTHFGQVIDMALTELADPERARIVRSRAHAWAAGFSWEASAEILARVVTAEIDRLGHPPEATGRMGGAPGRGGRQVGAGGAGAGRGEGGRVGAGERRRLDTDTTRAEFPLAPGAPLPRLRRTDLVYRDGGRGVAVLYGADRRGAILALARAGVEQPLEIRPASSDDLLVATTRAAAPGPRGGTGTGPGTGTDSAISPVHAPPR